MNTSEFDYEKLGFDTFMEKEGGLYGDPEMAIGSVDLGDGEIKKIKGWDLENLRINTWIKSRNYKPKVSGFMIDGKLGYIECMRLYVGEGGIVGGKLDIPNITDADSFHTDSSGNSWWGCNLADFEVSVDNAAAYILKTGIAKFQNVGLEGTVSLDIGTGNSKLKFNITDGLWLGHADFASAPFSVSLAGAIKGESGILGGWTIEATTLTATSITLDSGNERITVGASAPITIDGVNKRIRSDNYSTGVSGFSISPTLIEAENLIARGTMRGSVFAYDMINAIGGQLVVANADSLASDMTSAD